MPVPEKRMAMFLVMMLAASLVEVAARHHAMDQIVTKGADAASKLEDRYGFAQHIGLARAKVHAINNNAHRLFLKQ